MTTLTATPVSGGTTTATWDGIPQPTPKDWLGVYPQGSGSTDDFKTWVYVNGSQSPTVPVEAGTCAVPVPDGGPWEVRLMEDDKTTHIIATTPIPAEPIPEEPTGGTGVFFLNPIEEDATGTTGVPPDSTGQTGTTGIPPDSTGTTGSTGIPPASDLEERVTALEGKVTGLETDVNTLESKTANLQTRTEALESITVNLTTRTEATEHSVVELWAADKTQADQIAALDARVKKLEAGKPGKP